MMKVAVYSGSFNPLHIGHLAILRSLEEEFDRILLVVSPKNPLKDDIDAESGPERFRKALQAVGRHSLPKVVVDDIELGMAPPHFTIRTLDELKRREPANEFTLIMGADQIADIRRWKDYSRILCEYGVKVFPRDGFDLKSIKEDLLRENRDFKIGTIDAPVVNISSTFIRNGLARGEEMSEYLM